MIDRNLGLKLRERRKQEGLTLVELAELTGVDTSYLGRIENGKRFPSAHILIKLAEPLQYTQEELLKLAGYLSPDRTDNRISKFKDSLKGEIKQTLSNLLEKVDTL